MHTSLLCAAMRDTATARRSSAVVSNTARGGRYEYACSSAASASSGVPQMTAAATEEDALRVRYTGEANAGSTASAPWIAR